MYHLNNNHNSFNYELNMAKIEIDNVHFKQIFLRLKSRMVMLDVEKIVTLSWMRTLTSPDISPVQGSRILNTNHRWTIRTSFFIFYHFY